MILQAMPGAELENQKKKCLIRLNIFFNLNVARYL